MTLRLHVIMPSFMDKPDKHNSHSFCKSDVLQFETSSFQVLTSFFKKQWRPRQNMLNQTLVTFYMKNWSVLFATMAQWLENIIGTNACMVIWFVKTAKKSKKWRSVPATNLSSKDIAKWPKLYWKWTRCDSSAKIWLEDVKKQWMKKIWFCIKVNVSTDL